MNENLMNELKSITTQECVDHLTTGLEICNELIDTLRTIWKHFVSSDASDEQKWKMFDELDGTVVLTRALYPTELGAYDKRLSSLVYEFPYFHRDLTVPEFFKYFRRYFKLNAADRKELSDYLLKHFYDVKYIMLGEEW